MKIVKIEPLKPAVIEEIDGSLESMQKVVDGHIEITVDSVLRSDYSFCSDVVLVVNEEGKLLDLPLNFYLQMANGAVDAIVGTCFYVRLGEEDFESLTDDQIDAILESF